MALPEADLDRIRLWCREQVAEHLWDQVKVEADVGPRHVDIVELRPYWRGGDQPPTRWPIALLRYTAANGLWAISWRDRNSKFHEYRYKCPSKDVHGFLDYIGSHNNSIFFG